MYIYFAKSTYVKNKNLTGSTEDPALGSELLIVAGTDPGRVSIDDKGVTDCTYNRVINIVYVFRK